jgi:hypothetical protein
VLSEVRLPSRPWWLAAVALVAAVSLIAVTATGANAAPRLHVAARPATSCVPATISAPVIPRQTVASVSRGGGLAVKLSSAHPASWVLAVLVSARVGHTLGNPRQRGTVPIGSATKRFSKPGRATVRVPLPGAVVPPDLSRLPVTLIWTVSTQLGNGCTLFNGGQLPATIG